MAMVCPATAGQVMKRFNFSAGKIIVVTKEREPCRVSPGINNMQGHGAAAILASAQAH